MQSVAANGASINIQTQPAEGEGNNPLDLYLNSKRTSCSPEDVTRIWGWLWKIYEGTQPDADGSLWNARKGVPLRIELRRRRSKISGPEVST